jgi:hypothetical protein
VQRDERFQDMILLTKPAMKTAGITPGMPEMKPVLVDFLEIREPGTAPAPKAAPDASLTPPPADSNPSPAAEPAAEQTKQ